jgi:hypothetical protein
VSPLLASIYSPDKHYRRQRRSTQKKGNESELCPATLACYLVCVPRTVSPCCLGACSARLAAPAGCVQLPAFVQQGCTVQLASLPCLIIPRVRYSTTLALLFPSTQVACTMCLVVALVACATAAEDPQPEAETGLAPFVNRHLTQSDPKISWPSSECTKPNYYKENGRTNFRCTDKGRTSACCPPQGNTCIKVVDDDGLNCGQNSGKGSTGACCPWTGL